MGNKKRRSFTNKYGDPSLQAEAETPRVASRRSDDYMPEENDWVSRAYIPQNDSNSMSSLKCCSPFCCVSTSTSDGSCCGPCVSYTSKPAWCILMVCLFLLAAVGVGLMTFGALERVKPVVKLCTTCNGITVSALIAGGIAIALLFVGIVALYRMSRVLSVLFSILMLLICAMFLAVFVAVLVFRYDRDEGVMAGFEDMWTDTVRNDPSLACTVQSDLGCSGFQKGCCYTNSTPVNDTTHYDYCFYTLSNGTTVDEHGNVITWPKDQCPRNCVVGAAQTTTCSADLLDRVRTYLLPVTLVLGILSMIVAILSYLVPRIVFSKPVEEKKVRILDEYDDIAPLGVTVSSHSVMRNRRDRSPTNDERAGLLVLTDD